MADSEALPLTMAFMGACRISTADSSGYKTRSESFANIIAGRFFFIRGTAGRPVSEEIPQIPHKPDRHSHHPCEGPVR